MPAIKGKLSVSSKKDDAGRNIGIRRADTYIPIARVMPCMAPDGQHQAKGNAAKIVAGWELIEALGTDKNRAAARKLYDHLMALSQSAPPDTPLTLNRDAVNAVLTVLHHVLSAVETQGECK